MRIAVVGGGIGGLATALRLARDGHEIVVLERSAALAELGAGIQLAPNGIHALDRLGVGDDVRAMAVHIDELRFMDGLTGEHVVSMPLTGDYRRRFGHPYTVVHRGELHGLLVEKARSSPNIALRTSCTVTGYRHEGAGASVLVCGDERVRADAVIGADGVHSRIRAQLVGDGAPRVSGITVYRTVLPMERVPAELRWNAVTWWTGPGCHFVHYPIAGGRLLNLAGSHADGATEALAGVPAEPAAVRDRFAVLGAVPRRLVELGTDWRSWVLVDREPVDRWTDGPVALLGDAAHPMLHYAAQGACQALEDAVLLGDALAGAAGAADVAGALAGYAATRRERTARVQRLSWDSTRLWHAAGAAATARNAALAAMSADDLHDYVAWLHGARVEVAA